MSRASKVLAEIRNQTGVFTDAVRTLRNNFGELQALITEGKVDENALFAGGNSDITLQEVLQAGAVLNAIYEGSSSEDRRKIEAIRS